MPVPTSGSEEAPFSPGPPPSGAPARLVLSSSFPSRHSRRNLLAYLRTTYPHARLGAIVFSPAGGFDEAASGKGGVELWKHNSVWRMAYQTRSGEEALNRNDSLGRAGPTSLVPIEAFKRWERDWEEPTLDEGDLSLVRDPFLTIRDVLLTVSLRARIRRDRAVRLWPRSGSHVAARLCRVASVARGCVPRQGDQDGACCHRRARVDRDPQRAEVSAVVERVLRCLPRQGGPVPVRRSPFPCASPAHANFVFEDSDANEGELHLELM